MPSPEHRDPDQAGHIVGFHAQQAVEKSLKAIAALRGIEIPRTHDLSALVAVLDDHAIAAPATIEEARWLTPWAAIWRYEDEPLEVDRTAAVSVAEEAVAWSSATIAAE